MIVPPAPDSQAGHALRGDGEHVYDPSEHSFWKSVAGQPITPETTLFMLRKKWRIDQDTLTKFKAILEMYIGTHNFWNFTVGREFKEAAAKRLIKSIHVSGIQLSDMGAAF
jgi:tRNA pseudouridine38-40 synthase